MRKGSHTQYDLEYHIVWTTKYRYKVLNTCSEWQTHMRPMMVQVWEKVPGK